jgi:hypothetical protein
VTLTTASDVDAVLFDFFRVESTVPVGCNLKQNLSSTTLLNIEVTMRILQRNPRWKARFPVPVDWAFLGHLSDGVP